MSQAKLNFNAKKILRLHLTDKLPCFVKLFCIREYHRNPSLKDIGAPLEERAKVSITEEEIRRIYGTINPKSGISEDEITTMIKHNAKICLTLFNLT